MSNSVLAPYRHWEGTNRGVASCKESFHRPWTGFTLSFCFAANDRFYRLFFCTISSSAFASLHLHRLCC